MNRSRRSISANSSAILIALLWCAAGCDIQEDVQLVGDGDQHEVNEEKRTETVGDSQSDFDRQPRKQQKTKLPGEGQSADDLWEKSDVAAKQGPALPNNPPSRVQYVPAARLENLGIRIVEGRHLRLVTDVPAGDAVDGLPAVFDLAVPQWAAYFGIPNLKWSKWQMTAYLMADPDKFEAAGIYPKNELPAFKNGFTRGQEFWMFEQKADYYRRHLFLHEGVHGFMFTFSSTVGPPWYMEGMAELLATHRLTDEGLTVAYFPKDKSEVPLLGRIRIVKDEVAAGRTLTLRHVMSYGARAHLDNKPYGWCWAAAAFLDGHPRYRDRFRELNRKLIGEAFNDAFTKAYASDWSQLNEEWLIFAAGLQHDHDLVRSAVQYRSGQLIASESAECSIATDRGWQSSGVKLEAGKTYRVTASGRYQVAHDRQSRVWWCEPAGVTIRYHDNRPLGMLLGAIRPDEFAEDAVSPLFRPQPIGSGVLMTPQQSGTLYLRINESVADLADNEGRLNVQIRLAAGN